MISVVFAAAILFSDAAPAAATPAVPAAAATPATAPAPVKDAKVDRDAVVCHSEEVLGSRIAKRVCMSKAQSEDRARQSQMDLDRLQAQHGLRSN